ncbi:MAG: PIN domain-containing protein [Chloroflexi bacterium]|nr:PIN domain-containing protein [Chloroflexota bacterium]MDA8187271.1 PIN domain-containing protein [Dehalococcoidales bacterium]
MVEFLDANVIIRYATNDQPDHAARAKNLFEQVEQGKRAVTTCEGVLVEAVYVLSSKKLYNRSREEIRDYLTSLLDLAGLQLQHKRTYVRALDLYASSKLSFVDALEVAHMERSGIQTILNFDTHFDGISTVTRREP